MQAVVGVGGLVVGGSGNDRYVELYGLGIALWDVVEGIVVAG